MNFRILPTTMGVVCFIFMMPLLVILGLIFIFSAVFDGHQYEQDLTREKYNRIYSR